ncbi:MAG: flagellar basal body P-ring formation protein FlgA [Rhodospirillales bacterium]|nr:flagellar basal body P-ring formation protein FlgA [Rhodospirillales bacterium]
MKIFAYFLVFLATAIVAAAAPAPAQSLRTDLVVVEGDLVKLSDLFEGVSNDRPVLRAPAPGRRVSVEIQQLMEIARSNGLAWRPQTRFDRVLVERMGKTLDQNDIVPALRRALLAEGMRASDEIDLGSRNFTISLPLEAPADIDVRQVQLDRTTGRFTATLHAGGNHPGAQRSTVQGRVFATARLPVLRRTVAAGETIRAQDIEMAQVREDAGKSGLIANPDKLVGQTARQRLREREPVREIDVRPATLVARNANVTIVLQFGNMSLSAQGRAIEEGARGDTIRILNTTSNRQLEGVVVGPDTVAVSFGPRVAALLPQ